MKRLLYPLMSMLAFFLAFTACEEEELELGATSEAQFEQEMVADEVNTVRLIANDNGPAIYRWTLSTGQKFEGETVEVYLPFKGEYEVTLTAYSQGGSTSSVGKINIAETDPEICNVEALKFLTGGCGVDEGKTWVIDSTSKGHFGIGPASSNTPDWYSANPGDKAGNGLYNDRYTFKLINYKLDINTQGDALIQTSRASEFSGVEEVDQYDAVAQVSYDEPFTYNYYEEDGSSYLEIQGQGFLGYYTGQTRYEIVSISENEVFLKYDEEGVPGNAWFLRLVPAGFTPPPPPPPSTSTLPITFEDVASPFNGFGGSSFQIIDNPDVSGINTSAKVGELVKGTEVWAGIETTLEQAVDFTTQPIVKIKVWAPVTGVARLKFEDAADNTSFTELDANIEVTNEWVELTYDFSAAPSNVYSKMALFLDFGSGRTETFYFDDVRQTAAESSASGLPFSFEGTAPAFAGFEGAAFQVVDNPDNTGLNTSAKVGEYNKGTQQPYAGLIVTLDEAVNFDDEPIFKMLAYSPIAGRAVLKFENANDPGISVEKSFNITETNTWTELTFDFTGEASDLYQKMAVFMDIDNNSGGVFYIDNIHQEPTTPASVSALPVTFEGDAPAFGGFGGTAYQTIINPDQSGANVSTHVGEYVKGTEGSWAGLSLLLDETVDFSTEPIFKVKVWSPVTGRALLKFEVEGDASQNVEVFADITESNTWTELTFDFTGQESNKYKLLAFFMDFDQNNGGTFYFDDIRQVN